MKIGIIGDGQLALMLGESAAAQGYDFCAYGQDSESSFAVRFPRQFKLGKSDFSSAAFVDFAKECDVLTLENEFLSAETLLRLQDESGTPIIPDPESYHYFQDKISQRKFYESLGIPGPRWTNDVAAIFNDASLFAYPFVVKASQGGYDGYGVRIVQNETEFAEALKTFGHHEHRLVLVEEKVKIVREFAQGVLLDGKGNAIFLPLVETLQRNGTCVLTFSKSTLPESDVLKVKTQIRNALEKISKTRLKGLFNFEFFYTEAGDVWINEGAPRPHNSQHLTLDASPVSQFSILMKFLVDGVLDPEWIGREIPTKPAVMVNLLGKSTGKDYKLSWPELPASIEVHPKLYLKKECRPGRKMGHLNLIDLSNRIDLLALGEKVLKEYEL